MPGFVFAYDRKGLLQENTPRFNASVTSLKYLPHIEHTSLYRDDSYRLAEVSYTHYPISSYEDDEYRIFIEGMVYGSSRSHLTGVLRDIVEGIFRGTPHARERLSGWIAETDGEFVVVAFRKSTSDCLIFNDALGHLPLYYLLNDRHLVVSREIGFIHHFIDDCRIDRKALAHLLLFCFPLGSRTTIENVRKLPAGTMISIAHAGGEVSFHPVCRFNFEAQVHRGRSIGENVDNLIDIWHEAVKARGSIIDQQKNVLALSGGLDSRSVAAGLFKNGMPFVPVTYIDDTASAQRDLDVAHQLARIMNIPLEVVPLAAPTGRDAFALLKMKYGLNYLGMSFILGFLEHLRQRWGPRIVYFSGDTGMVMRDYRPNMRVRDRDDFIRAVFGYGGRFSTRALFSLKEVSMMTGIGIDDIYDDIREEIASYPEQSMEEKFVHFVFNGYCFNWHYEGIDRNRMFFWLAHPFESVPFFTYAMNIKSEQKKHYRLYRAFIRAVMPEAAPIVNASWNMPIDSSLLEAKLYARKAYLKLPARIRRMIRNPLKMYPPYPADSPVMACFLEQVRELSAYPDYLALPVIAGRAGSLSSVEFNTLFTVTSLIEFFHGGHSTLEQYADREFA